MLNVHANRKAYQGRGEGGGGMEVGVEGAHDVDDDDDDDDCFYIDSLRSHMILQE